MTLHVDLIEAAWIVMNATALLVTSVSVVDAVRDWHLARDLNGGHEARRLVAVGNVRRETLRALIQVLLLSLVLPGLSVDLPTTLNPFSVTLIAISLILLAQTLLDARARHRLIDLLSEAPRNGALESSVQENIALTKDAGVKADAAEVAASTARDAAKDAAATVHEEVVRLTDLVNDKQSKR